jgi:cytochrome b561
MARRWRIFAASGRSEPMQWSNTKSGYGWLSIALHWFAALGVLLMLTIGLRADALGEAGDRAGRAAAMGWHISVGATLIVFLLARIIAHYAQPQPEAPPQPRALNLLSSATHNLLLLAILLLILSGPMAVWTGGRAINVWNVISLPSPFAARNEGAHELAETVHAVGRYMLYVLIPLHLIGVAKHVFIDKDGVLGRMLSPKATLKP